MMSQPQQVSVTDLDVSQLAEVRRQLEEELNHLTNSFAQLKRAQATFKACGENAAELKAANTGRTVLVPLTNSLYVPGTLSDPAHVLVDVGTGYFVRKTREQAREHYSAKVEYIRTNLGTLEDTIGKKRENIGYLVDLTQAKLRQSAS
ncbi:Prefoldin subunit-domain-containing protein [Mycena belliarum]|uniref:Prefoldin subunit-domain-containing protein n=1 Tax=Mycena belliarum TaxID=1033014 RepID=A0AAD6UAA3_9AGAR|nr:Prefoldin subunit-domain-containing protein [Mycena belliae]